MRVLAAFFVHDVVDLTHTQGLVLIENRHDAIPTDIKGTAIIIKGRNHFPTWLASTFCQLKNPTFILTTTTNDLPTNWLALN